MNGVPAQISRAGVRLGVNEQRSAGHGRKQTSAPPPGEDHPVGGRQGRQPAEPVGPRAAGHASDQIARRQRQDGQPGDLRARLQALRHRDGVREEKQARSGSAGEEEPQQCDVPARHGRRCGSGTAQPLLRGGTGGNEPGHSGEKPGHDYGETGQGDSPAGDAVGRPLATPKSNARGRRPVRNIKPPNGDDAPLDQLGTVVSVIMGQDLPHSSLSMLRLLPLGDEPTGNELTQRADTERPS